MYKKTLLTLAVASSLGLSGCLDDEDSGARNANPNPQIIDTTIDTSLTRPIFNPFVTASDFSIPANSDLVLLLGAGQSPNYDFTGFASGTDPASSAINDLAGFSVSSPIDIRFNGSVDESSVVLGQSVHLVPLVMNPLSPATPNIELTGNPSYIDLSDLNPLDDGQVSPFDTTKFASQNVRTEVISLDGRSKNTIRITPLEPLDDQTKYLVIITNGVTSDGEPIAQSTEYANITGEGALGNPAFQTIRDVLQAGQGLGELWAAINGVQDDVALAYTLTTQNTQTVLNSMTSPASYLAVLGEQVALYSGLQVVKDSLPAQTPASTVFSTLAETLPEITDGIPEGDLQTALLGALAPYLSNTPVYTSAADLTAGDTSTQVPFANAVVGGAASALPIPQPRAAQFYSGTTRAASTLAGVVGAASVDALPSVSFDLATAAESVNVTEGAIELPYYLELPGDDGRGIVDGMWRGSETLETTLNTVIENLVALNSGNIPTLAAVQDFAFPRDTDGSFNVTQYMPFPEENARVVVPVVAYYPSSGCTIQDVVIFQHGIRVDRSVSMIPATRIVNDAENLSRCVAVVAMDQPIHGLGGENKGTAPGLQALNEYVDSDFAGWSENAIISERHFFYTAKSPSEPLTPDLKTDITEVSSGSLAINPLSLQTTRDTLRQGVVDLLNLAATMNNGSFDIDGDGTNYNGASLWSANDVDYHFVGHSLGGITGTPFVALAQNTSLRSSYSALNAANSDIPATGFYPDFKSISLINTGSQLSRIGENSPALSTTILGGLAAENVNQGSSDFETFFYAWQSTLDSTDPVSFAESLGKSYLLALADEWVNPVTGAQQPYPFGPVPDTSILISEVVGDLTVPNEANVSPLGQALSAPLAGTEPLMALVNLGAGVEPLNSGSIVSATTPTLISSVANGSTFFFGQNPCANANHGTFVAPVTPEDADDVVCPGGSITNTAFDEMVDEVVGNILDQNIPVVDSSVLGDSPTLDNALDNPTPANL